MKKDQKNKPFTTRNVDQENYTDLPDSPQDQEKLKPEVVIMDLPDVKDIPGQEHIHVPPLGELADTTISSDDEEGASVFDDGHEEDFPGEPVMDIAVSDEPEEDETKPVMGNDADVSDEEKEILRRADQDMPTTDDINLRRSALDNKDAEGELLNEDSQDVSGDDLDVPGSELDDDNEVLGEEDEENNPYSLGGDKHD
jgi:hypothetical protein